MKVALYKKGNARTMGQGEHTSTVSCALRSGTSMRHDKNEKMIAFRMAVWNHGEAAIATLSPNTAASYLM